MALGTLENPNSTTLQSNIFEVWPIYSNSATLINRLDD